MGWLKALWRWFDDRLGFTDAVLPIVEHPTPKTDWWYVLGSATLAAFIVQVVTGVALAFSYVPAPNSAYQSLEWISHEAILGSVVRGIHFWGASAMVVLIFCHVAHTFLIGSFKFPREMNWLTGTLLLVFTMGMAFTGQLLRWNQDAYWAVVVGAAQAVRAPLIGEFLASVLIAGQTVGGATLTRFYATHVFLIPAAMFVLLGTHLYLVIRHGVSELPEPGRPVNPKTYRKFYQELLHTDGVPFWPDAAWKDVVFALAVGALVLVVAIVVGPPELGAQADPTNLKAYPRPDWYFLWYYALLALTPAELENILIIGFPLALGIAFFALPIVAPYGERSPRRRPWAVAIVMMTAVSILALWRLGEQGPWAPEFQEQPLPAAVTANLQGSAQQGAELFVSKGCQSCHVLAGYGGERGPNLTYVGDRLTRDELTWRIGYGGHNMPAFGSTLTSAEMNALVDFLATRKAQPSAAP